MPDGAPPALVLHECRTLLDSWNVVYQYDVENTSDGRHAVREVVQRPDIAVVLPFSRRKGTATFVSQARLAAHLAGWTRPLLEAPSGRIDAGETPEEAGLRELHEETGLVVSGLQPWGSLFLHPALSVERAHLFTCDLDHCLVRRDVPQTGDMLGPSEVVEIGLRTMSDGCDSGIVMDAKTVLLLQRLEITMPQLFSGDDV